MLVATSSIAAAQATAVGQELHQVTVYDGRLYASYGDYGANTGPIDVISLDLANTAAGFTSEATLHTEETWLYRNAGSRQFVSYIDPQGYGDGTQGQLAIAATPGTWRIVTNVTPVPIHVMACCETADGIFLFGAANEPDPPNGGATVWRSTDDGATWTVSLAPRPDPTNGARFYAPMLYGDVIETQLVTSPTVVYRWEGASWSVVADQAPGSVVAEAVPFTYLGTAFQFCLNDSKPQGHVVDSQWHIRTQAADAAVRDTITATIPVVRARGAVVDGAYLYLLDQDGSVWRAADDLVWTRLFTLDLIPASLAVDGTTAYFGTADSKVYSTPIP